MLAIKHPRTALSNKGFFFKDGLCYYSYESLKDIIVLLMKYIFYVNAMNAWILSNNTTKSKDFYHYSKYSSIAINQRCMIHCIIYV